MAAVDPAIERPLEEGTLSVASSGTDNCVIDLKKVRCSSISHLKRLRAQLQINGMRPPCPTRRGHRYSMPLHFLSGMCNQAAMQALGVLSISGSIAETAAGGSVQVSPKLNDIAKDADFVVLEGMGRGIETNLWGAFRGAALQVGMIKHREVALELGGDMFDCVCKFTPAPAH